MLRKEEIRRDFFTRRKELSSREIDDFSQKITDRLFEQFNFSKINYLHLFLPIRHLKEVNTWLIVTRIESEYPSVRILVPKILEYRQMGTYYLHRETPISLKNRVNLQLSTSKILEPASQEWKVSRRTEFGIDMILVPTLATDLYGNRIGYGGGYYDRFLQQIPDALRVGLSIFPPVEFIETTYGDQRLDYAITPDAVHTYVTTAST